MNSATVAEQNERHRPMGAPPGPMLKQGIVLDPERILTWIVRCVLAGLALAVAVAIANGSIVITNVRTEAASAQQIDYTVKGVTFQQPKPGRRVTTSDPRIACYGPDPLYVTAQVQNIGRVKAQRSSFGSDKSSSYVMITARPIDGGPAEQISSKADLQYERVGGHSVLSYGWSPTLPDSFRGRTLEWTAVVHHPRDGDNANDKVEKITLAPC